MTADIGAREKQPARDPIVLPRVLNVESKIVPYRPPKLKFLKSPFGGPRDVLGLIVQTDGPLFQHANSPMLFVGDVPLTEGEALDLEKNLYVYYVLDEKPLQDGAPIALGWPGQSPGKRSKTGFVYKRPD